MKFFFKQQNIEWTIPECSCIYAYSKRTEQWKKWEENKNILQIDFHPESQNLHRALAEFSGMASKQGYKFLTW